MSRPSGDVTVKRNAPSVNPPESYRTLSNRSRNVMKNVPATPATNGPGTYVCAPRGVVRDRDRAAAFTVNFVTVNPANESSPKGVKLKSPLFVTENDPEYVPSSLSVSATATLDASLASAPTRETFIVRASPPETSAFAFASRAVKCTAYDSPATAVGTPAETATHFAGEIGPGTTETSRSATSSAPRVKRRVTAPVTLVVNEPPYQPVPPRSASSTASAGFHSFTSIASTLPIAEK